MSIQALRLRNFKGFSEATITLKPLTVLLGPNSAGKSAFGHAVAAMAHAQWLHAGGNQATLTPRSAKDSGEWPIDLGDLDDLRTAGTRDRPYVDLLTNDGWVKFGFGGPEVDRSGLRLSYLNYPVSLHESATRSISGQPTSQPELGPESATGPAIDSAVTGSKRGLVLVRRDEVFWLDQSDEGHVREAHLGLDGLLLQTVRHTGGTEIPIPVPAMKDLGSFLKNLSYLRGTRVRPSRCYEHRPPDERTAVGYAGEYSPSILLSERGKEVDFMSPPLFPGKDVDGWSVGDGWKQTRDQLERALGFWLDRLGLAARALARDSARYRGFIETQIVLGASGVPRDITEVGFGISQVVPVIVAGLLQTEGSLFVVDLPEAHLHPRPQSSLADFFCSLALSGRSALVETHSEMFFHRLRLRAAMDTLLRDNIAVYFIDPPKDGLCCEPREVGLDFENELRWPPGFLQEAWEIEDHIKAVRLARAKR